MGMERYPAVWYSNTSKGFSGGAAVCEGAAIVVAELVTEDEVAVVAVLDTESLRSFSDTMVVLVGFLPKKAAGWKDSSSACLGVMVCGDEGFDGVEVGDDDVDLCVVVFSPNIVNVVLLFLEDGDR
jgi:hypothetical protein